MVLVLKDGASKKEIADIEKQLDAQSTIAGFDAKKYNGILKLEKDPMEIQKELRDEWERHPG